MQEYIKIKELSELTGVSVRTLQYYDEINLLRPAYTNEYGHRFYDSNSFSKMFVIIYYYLYSLFILKAQFHFIDGQF